MFKFNFFPDNTETTDLVKKNNIEEWVESKRILPEKTYEIDFSDIKKYECDGITISYLNSQEITRQNSLFKNIEDKHLDLVPAIYEGGMKIWECTYDLLNHIQQIKLDLSGKKVLDLGCGSGLVGILCYLKGSQCTFQDYNSEVISNLTIPNVQINKQNESWDGIEFYSGDWGSFSALLPNEQFDYIFTSETIYNTENYEKLINIFKTLLRKTGIIYLAAKTYYFGVGGGVDDFMRQLEKENIFSHSILWKCTQGIERQIIEIKFK